MDMISDSSSEALIELAKHLGSATEIESAATPSFWNADQPCVFISHLASIKAKAKGLKASLSKYSIVSFVAHEDIEPTKEWQTEIEIGLSTMDALVAMLTPGFKESNWTDQEVGFAIGRGVPIVPVRIGLDPYGFIGKYQALQGKGREIQIVASEITEILLGKPGIGQKITSGIVEKFVNSYSWETAKQNMGLLEKCQHLNMDHIKKLRKAVKENRQVRDSWGVPERLEALIE
ncbi:MAG: toll/interleukin-1 receptor domain-containing protein [Desulfobacterales bacterium]|nr:toll/interleukin-1 receptor domain-containing protein [Desulfobacterales bacterium]